QVEKLADYLVDNGSDSILITGTTGESPTLTHEEEFEILLSVKSIVGDRAKIIMGAGSNSTETAVETSKRVAQAGVDAILSVVPYYNKPSQKGMIAHFGEIAKAVDIPIILYNIPGRTGVNMQPETIAKLAKLYPNIVGVKESLADMETITEVKRLCPEDFVIYSGDDSLTLPMLALGAHGVVSVASHLVGKDMKSMIRNFKTGEVKAALNMHNRLFPLFRKLFMAPNPIPVKQALSRLGMCENYVRRPLTEMDEDQIEELYNVLDMYYEKV
ncbi:MAG: 4-hydroxy-tetrahydrodipicolinate synthase, partial [Clostridia bacterium]|nr:4-hydroxy-tetrahydrodipicolinate synthase [Clostridia bacterium]